MSAPSGPHTASRPVAGREPGRSGDAHAIARLRAIAFMAGTFGSVLLVGFWLVPLAFLFTRPEWLKAPCRWWVRLSLPLLGVHVRIKGGEHFQNLRGDVLFQLIQFRRFGRDPPGEK